MEQLITALIDMTKPRPGWIGGFTTQQAPGAIANGTRVVKFAQDSPSDMTPLGTEGAVLGSLEHPDLGLCYFVEWDDKPKVAVAVVAWKIKAAD